MGQSIITSYKDMAIDWTNAGTFESLKVTVTDQVNSKPFDRFTNERAFQRFKAGPSVPIDVFVTLMPQHGEFIGLNGWMIDKDVSARIQF